MTTLDDSVLGDPITYAQCEQIPGSDAPMTLPVYTLPSGLAYMPGQSSFQTVLASGTSSRPKIWSSAIASPLDTEDSPLLTTGLPGCPYRLTSYREPAFSDLNQAFGLQLHHPQFLEFVGASVVPFADVLGGSTWRGTGDGSSSQPVTGRGHYFVQSSYNVAVCDVATSDVVGNYVHRHGTGGVSCSRDKYPRCHYGSQCRGV